MSLVSNKNIATYLFGLLFIYQMIGVAIHKQYGFGFFYWPVQEYLLLLLSLWIIFVNSNSFISFFKMGILYHIYIILIIFVLIVYISGDSTLYAPYIGYEEKWVILSETITWYIISLGMSFSFKYLFDSLTIKKLTIVYFTIAFFFFAYVIHLNGNDIARSFIMGANFASKDITIFLSSSGYVKGFHLYFSPLFAIYSIVYLYFLKENKKYVLLISLLSIYILYLAGGRGSMLSFVASIFIIMTSNKQKIVLFLFIIFVILPSGSILEEYNPRFYKVITLNFEDDPSAIGRLHDLNNNLTYIQDNIFVGGLRGYKEIHSAYIHSALSILQEYGILIFTVFILMIIHALIVLIKLRKSSIFILFSMCYLYVVLDMLLFKYVHEVHTMIIFVIVYLNILFYNRNRNRNRNVI